MPASRFPLQWPIGQARTPPSNRKYGGYKVSPDRALRDLLDEIRMLGGRNLIVSSNAKLRKREELPRADDLALRLDDPGVAVYFDIDDEPVVIACDSRVYPWANVRAIGLTVSGLRMIQRSGATELLHRAFRGFTAIEGPIAWWAVLGVPETASAVQIRNAHREKAIIAHPDRGGTDDAMANLNRARDEGLKACASR